jgi:hypothetical protein
LSLAAESVQSPTPSNRMGAFHEERNRSASACHARRAGRFGSDSKHTAAAAGGIAAANINRQHLHPRLRLVRYVLPEYVCGACHCHVAGQSAMQSELHYIATRLQATVLTVGLPRGKYLGKRLGNSPASEAEQLHPVPSLRRLDGLPRSCSSVRARRAVATPDTGSTAIGAQFDDDPRA